MPRVAPLVLAALVLSATLLAQLPAPTTGDLLVSSFGSHQLLRLSPSGQQIGSVAVPANSAPRGVAVHRPTSEVFVALQNLDEVLVLTPSLTTRSRFATTGVQSPTGLAFGPGGDLFVPGFVSGTIGRYRPDGTHVATWGPFTPAIRPNCLAFLPDGTSFVADVSSNGVVRLDANGQETGRFTGFGLRSPMGTAIHGGELFVCGGSSHNVAVFDLQGNPRRSFQHADMSGPQGMAFDEDGQLLVTNYFNHMVNAFRSDGTWLWSTRPPSANTPRGFALLERVTATPPSRPIAGTPTPFAIRSPHEPGSGYVSAVSFGTTPGIPLPDGSTWDLAPDALFLGSVLNPSPVFQDFFGLLDARGSATATLRAPALPVLQGVDLHFGVFTVRPGNTPTVGQVAETVTFRY